MIYIIMKRNNYYVNLISFTKFNKNFNIINKNFKYLVNLSVTMHLY